MPDIMQPGVPAHVAIIMDGNGRWAKRQGKPRLFGHRAGRDAVDRCVEYCAKQGVKVLTLFAFSTENWQRPSTEVTVLMELMSRALKDYLPTLLEHGIRLQVLGDRARLSRSMQHEIKHAEQLTASGTGMLLVLALNYSGRWAILQAAKNLAHANLDEESLESLDEDRFGQFFPQPCLPDVDLLIRSSGELRISNFLLWELAYAEMYFTDVLWPDMDESVMTNAFRAYQCRERRFGTLPGESC